MRTVGLITEYNPFHNGHLHHLQESKRVAGADASVAIMSGHFLQRGEPALVDKWARTEMALAAGVDLVFELPFPFACNSAPHFAMGAVRSLAATGVVESICFGSEAGDIERLDQVAAALVDNDRDIEAETASLLREGVNYPAAREKTLKSYCPALDEEVLGSPNNILGIEYLKALRKTGSAMNPYTIKRLGAGYHDTDAVGEIASATGIRHKLAAGEDVKELLPEASYKVLIDALQGGNRLDEEKLFISLQSHLLQQPEQLGRIYMVNDGMERRLSLAALEATDFKDLAERVKTRQWTLTRVQRTLMYVLTQALDSDMSAFVQAGPLYLRLLGHNETGRSVLARLRKKKALPVIADPARSNHTLRRFYRNNPPLGRLAEEMMSYDVRATQLYSLLCEAFKGRYRNQDYFQQVRQV